MPTQRMWTEDTVLQAIHSWMTSHQGRWPTHKELRKSNGLPQHSTIQEVIGGHRQLHQRYAERYPSREGWVRCPRCEQCWWSPDTTYTKQHPKSAWRSGTCKPPTPRRVPMPVRAVIQGQEVLVRDYLVQHGAPGVTPEMFWQRRQQGWSDDEALHTPHQGTFNRWLAKSLLDEALTLLLQSA